MKLLKAVALAAMLVAIFLISMAISDSYYRANADTTEKINIEPGVPNASRIATRLRARLTDSDDIKVWIVSASSTITVRPDDVVVILAKGDVVTVRGNDWVPQNVMDDILYRNRNVSQDPVDAVMGIIQMVHEYQANHSKPKPPPPPAAPAAPRAPEPPTDWVSIGLWVTGTLFGVGFFYTWYRLHRRLRRRQADAAKIARDAEVQADWGLDDYGIEPFKPFT